MINGECNNPRPDRKREIVNVEPSNWWKLNVSADALPNKPGYASVYFDYPANSRPKFSNLTMMVRERNHLMINDMLMISALPTSASESPNLKYVGPVIMPPGRVYLSVSFCIDPWDNC